MKKRIFLLSTMLISIITFSQEIFNSKYMEVCEFNYKLDDYEIVQEVWMDVELTAYEDYCIILAEGEEEKMWWEVSEEESDGDFIVFYTEDQEDKIVFDGDEERILMFFEYNGRKDRYDGLVILSKIE